MDGDTGGMTPPQADEALSALSAAVFAADEEGERARLDAIASHDPDSLLDDPELERLADFTAKLCAAPIALVSLVEEQRQRFLARHGLAATETPRSQSFCQYAMRSADIYEVTDAAADPRFADNELVTGEPHIRFYAGARLISSEGEALGALCVIDSEPRPGGLSALQREGLEVLSRAVMRRLNDRRMAIAGERTAAELAESRARFDALADAIPQMAWSSPPDGRTDYFNARWEDFTGAKADDHYGEGWVDALHPDDRGIAQKAWASAIASGEPYEVEYRLRRHDGEYRWTLARGLPMRDESGTIVRWFGTNTDIHERHLLEESRDLLGRELNHRIKNIFSLVSGLISFEARNHPQLKPLADGIRKRVGALGRAHDYVLPQGAGDSAQPTLQGLLNELFAPYVDVDSQRVRVTGEDVPIDGDAVTPLALLFHELATNAMKYGGLSRDDGVVEVAIHRGGEGDLWIEWCERGGPDPDGTMAPSFGSSLIDLSITKQLKGTIQRRWKDGFCADIRMPLTSLR